VLDVASGPGTTAFLLASEFGVEVNGVDLGDLTVAKANGTAASEGIGDRVRFHRGDAERIPLPDASVDAVVCECAFCTFPDKKTAAAEMARVLKPGGRVGITYVALEPTRLDAELQSLAGWVSCLADARPVVHEDLRRPRDHARRDARGCARGGVARRRYRPRARSPDAERAETPGSDLGPYGLG
jgi:arsenite methyltransferase